MKLESMTKTASNLSDINIKLNGASVEQSSKVILSNVTLEIKKGTMTAILGKSGAGKSTLLRTVAGLIKPSKNTILINDVDFFSLGKKDKTNHVSARF